MNKTRFVHLPGQATELLGMKDLLAYGGCAPRPLLGTDLNRVLYNVCALGFNHSNMWLSGNLTFVNMEFEAQKLRN